MHDGAVPRSKTCWGASRSSLAARSLQPAARRAEPPHLAGRRGGTQLRAAGARTGGLRGGPGRAAGAGDREHRRGRRSPVSARGSSRCCPTCPRWCWSSCPAARSARPTCGRPPRFRAIAAGLPAAARRAAVRQRLRHLRQARRTAGHLRAARPAAAGRLPRPPVHSGATSRAALAARRCRACRATTTCWRRTSSTRPAVVRIVDYQLSGNNDPAFELGDIAAEADFDPDRRRALAAAYFGAEAAPALAGPGAAEPDRCPT